MSLPTYCRWATKLRRNNMEKSRLLNVDGMKNYVIPAIVLKKQKPWYDNAIHIGRIKSDGSVACFCGQHLKQEKGLFTEPSLSTAEYITCKSCLQTLRNVIANAKVEPYKAIMSKLEQKFKDIEFHVVEQGSAGDGDYVKGPPVLYSRYLHGGALSRLFGTGLIMPACFDGSVTDVPTRTKKIHAATYDIHGRLRPVCGEENSTVFTTWIRVHDDVHPDINFITCQKCVSAQVKKRLEEQPKRDKTLEMRKSMILQMVANVTKIYKEHKPVFDFIADSNNKMDIPANWRQLAIDYNNENNRLLVLSQGVIFK